MTGVSNWCLNTSSSLDCDTDLRVLIPLFGLAHELEFVVRVDAKDFKHKNVYFRRGQKASSTTFYLTLMYSDKQSLRTGGTSRMRMSTSSSLYERGLFCSATARAGKRCNFSSKSQTLLSTLLQFITYVIWLLAYENRHR